MKKQIDNIEQIEINKLVPAEYNPRRLTKKQHDDIKASLEKYGFVDPVIVNTHPDRQNVIIGGHQRVKVWKSMGNDTAPCVLVACDIKEEQELNVRLNKNTGEFDWDMLANHFDQADLIEWGFEHHEFGVIETLEPEKTEGDDDVPESAPPITVLGDIYELGGVHRVMCGDSLSSDSVERLMDGQKAVLAHNDPPYGMKKEKEGIQNDNLNYDDLLEFNSQWIPLQFTHLEDNGSFYCWGIDEPLIDIYSHILKPLIKTQKATFRNLITWNKGAFGSGGGTGVGQEIQRSYFPADEKCLFVMCGVQGFNNNADNYFEGWDSIRDYLRAEKKKSGFSNAEINRYWAEKTNKSGQLDRSVLEHYWGLSQWIMPTSENYKIIQDYCKTNNIDAFKKEYDELKKEYYSTRAYFNNTHDKMTNVWDIARTKGKEREQTGGHATPKPLELCDRVIKSSSPEGAIVTDWFLGSGSTLISCEKLGRKCYGMELDPKYCDVIVKRYVEFCKANNRPYEVKRNGQITHEF
jgi:DNA modification methylase